MRISDWSSDVCSSDLARAFAAEGLTACVNRRERHADALEALAQSIRDAGDAARAFPADARNEEAMIALFDAVEAEVGPTAVAVFNIGANVTFPIVETTARVIATVWEMACFAGFLMGSEAAKRATPGARAP